MVAMLKMPSALRLTPPNRDEASSADRRIFPRTESDSRVQGVRVDHTIRAHRQPQLSLSLRDISVGGLSAITSTPLEAGERLSVVFPPQFGRAGWDACGRVVRCEASSMGYRVALQFDHLAAAA